MGLDYDGKGVLYGAKVPHNFSLNASGVLAGTNFAPETTLLLIFGAPWPCATNFGSRDRDSQKRFLQGAK